MKWTTTNLGVTARSLQPGESTDEIKEYLYDADSPDDCDACDVWVAELETVRRLLLNVSKEAEVLERGYF